MVPQGNPRKILIFRGGLRQVKRKNEHIASFLENIENVLFANEDISFKSYDDYLTSIDEMGEWYVDHIATYQKEVSDNATKNAIE